MVATALMQSSSIVCAIITPLCGVGVISLDRAYVMIIGSCIGTAATGLVAAFANMSAYFREAMQVALAHLLFNLFGCVMWYVLPVMRRIPIDIALFAGEMTKKYRWWALCYIIGMFIIVPFLTFLVSILSTVALAALVGSVGVVLVIVSTINAIRRWKPTILPVCLQSWKWLPEWMRSLEPVDRALCSKISWCDSESSSNKISQIPTGDSPAGEKNEAFVENEL